MSYVPESEEINNEKTALQKDLKHIIIKLDNRILDNEGGWSKDHIKECMIMRTKLIELRMELEEW